MKVRMNFGCFSFTMALSSFAIFIFIIFSVFTDMATGCNPMIVALKRLSGQQFQTSHSHHSPQPSHSLHSKPPANEDQALDLTPPRLPAKKPKPSQDIDLNTDAPPPGSIPTPTPPPRLPAKKPTQKSPRTKKKTPSRGQPESEGGSITRPRPTPRRSSPEYIDLP